MPHDRLGFADQPLQLLKLGPELACLHKVGRRGFGRAPAPAFGFDQLFPLVPGILSPVVAGAIPGSRCNRACMASRMRISDSIVATIGPAHLFLGAAQHHQVRARRTASRLVPLGVEQTDQLDALERRAEQLLAGGVGRGDRQVGLPPDLQARPIDVLAGDEGEVFTELGEQSGATGAEGRPVRRSESVARRPAAQLLDDDAGRDRPTPASWACSARTTGRAGKCWNTASIWCGRGSIRLAFSAG